MIASASYLQWVMVVTFWVWLTLMNLLFVAKDFVSGLEHYLSLELFLSQTIFLVTVLNV